MTDCNISIVLTVHNKQDLIGKVYKSIVDNISGYTKEIIVVFDGCTDQSEFIIDGLDSPVPLKKLYTPDIFESRANTAGLKEVKTKYSIIIQDDVVVLEKDFDIKLVNVLEKNSDIFAVSARNAHNICYNNFHMNYSDMTGPEVNSEKNKLFVRQVINRGPIAFVQEDLKRLNYFDEEFAPNAYDDMDLCFRAYKFLNKKCGSYRIDFDSKPEWGTGRQKNQNLHSWAHQKNSVILLLRHRELIESKFLNEERGV